MNQYLFGLKRKPTMTESEWHRAGWKAAPTPHQMREVLDGMCQHCKFQAAVKRPQMGRLLAGLVGVACLTGLLIYLGITVGQ